MTNAAQYAGVVDRLPAVDFRYLAADLMGHGFTRIADDQPLGMDAQAAVLAELIDRLGVAPVHLVGSDSGGGVAQVLAVEHPDLVRSTTTGRHSWPRCADPLAEGTLTLTHVVDNQLASEGRMSSLSMC